MPDAPNRFPGPKVPAASVSRADYAYMLVHLKQSPDATKCIKNWDSRAGEFNVWINDILKLPPAEQAELAAQSTNPDVAATVVAYKAWAAKKRG